MWAVRRVWVCRWRPVRSCQFRVFSSSGASKVVSGCSYDKDSGVVSVRVPCDGGDGEEVRRFQTVVGIEIHAQLKTCTKLFSAAPTKHEHRASHGANTSVHPFDVGYPGTLPLLSRSAVLKGVVSCIALNCEVQRVSRFERKHYAYPDLPMGYQVTQQRWPLATSGYLDCRYAWTPQQKKNRNATQNTFFRVNVDRVQLEQDTGKTITHQTPLNQQTTLIDLNRAGCALIEIVFRPDIRSAQQAAAVVTTLQRLLRHIDTCDGKMEQGSFRCDLNVSVAPLFQKPHSSRIHQHNPYKQHLPPNTGHRVEVKNLNSVRQVIAATEYEVLRQAQDFCEGTPTEQETRTFDAATGQTLRMRRKEGSIDYRFMPEPDVPPLVLDQETLGGQTLEEILLSMPELPEQITARLVKQYNLSEDVALVIASDPAATAVFEQAVQVVIQELSSTTPNNISIQREAATAVANWLCNDLFALVKDSAATGAPSANEGKRKQDATVVDEEIATVANSPVDGERLGSLVAMVLDGTVSHTSAKKILRIMHREDPDGCPRDIAKDSGWQLVKDAKILESCCHEVILDKAFERQWKDYNKGGKKKNKMEKFFFGKVMSAFQGNADPTALRQVLHVALRTHSKNYEDDNVSTLKKDN